jgi:hypothetical protein
LAVAIACTLPAQAQEGDREAIEREKVEVLHETTMNLVKLLIEQGVIKQEVADGMLAEAEKRAKRKLARERAAEKAKLGEIEEQNKGVVRVTYVPEHVKREIRDQVRQEVVAQAKQERWGEVNAVPEWLDRLKWEGDLRLRYQGDFFADGNAPEVAFQSIGQNASNTQEDRHRERIRLRLGLNANVTPGVDAGVRITTGNTGDPVSTNQTLGNTNNKYSLVLDRAFLKVKPFDWLVASGGRIPNPFFSTDLVWDDDVNFEGVAATFTPWPNDNTRTLKPFLTAGVFPLQEIEESASVHVKDKWLYGAQLGAEWTPNTRTRIKGGLALYEYRHTSGIANPALGDTFNNQSAPQSRQKGNSLFNIDNDGNAATNLWALAPEYQIANLTLVTDFAQYDPIHVIGSFDWARNIGFDRDEILARTGQSFDEDTDGYQVKLTIGYPKISLRHEWQAFVGYRYLEADAVLDAFTDSDFHLGGTNAKGFMIGGSYGLDKNTWLSARWMSSDEISGLPLSIDVFQLDLNAKF